jgi:hypothetical protein
LIAVCIFWNDTVENNRRNIKKPINHTAEASTANITIKSKKLTFFKQKPMNKPNENRSINFNINMNSYFIQSGLMNELENKILINPKNPTNPNSIKS